MSQVWLGLTLLASPKLNRTISSARFRLVLDDVGIGTSATSVIRSYAVVIECIRTQASHIQASPVADIQIPIPRHIIGKRIVCRYIQPVAGSAADTCPVGSEAAGALVASL